MQNRARLSYLAVLLLLFVACESPTDQKLMGVQAVILEAVGDSKQLEASVSGTDALPAWESLNPGVVTVTRAGMVTAVGAGTATVRATLGSETAHGQVTVLPPVNVEITSATRVPGNPGWDDVTLRIRNTGGRGYYRTRFYRAASTPGGQPEIVSQMLTDIAIAAGQPELSAMTQIPASAEWAVIYSRDPHSMEYRTTACARLDGAAGCPAS